MEYETKKEIRLRKNAERKLEQLASTDMLTGISNRYKIDQILKQQTDQ